MAKACIIQVANPAGGVLGNLGLQAAPQPSVYSWGYQAVTGNPFYGGAGAGYALQCYNGAWYVALYDSYGNLLGTLPNLYVPTVPLYARGWLNTFYGSFAAVVTYVSLTAAARVELLQQGIPMPYPDEIQPNDDLLAQALAGNADAPEDQRSELAVAEA
jgi:hypothetical protein